MEHVFSNDPAIIVVEPDDAEAEESLWHVYAEGVHVGMAWDKSEAIAIAEEVYESLTGDDEREGAIEDIG